MYAVSDTKNNRRGRIYMERTAEPGVIYAGSQKSSKKYKIIVDKTRLLKTTWMPARLKDHGH